MEKELEIIKQIIQEIVGENLSRIILFGSRARGDYNKDSDYDLMVEIKNSIDINSKRLLRRLIVNKLAKNLIDVDIIIKSNIEILKFSQIAGTTTYNANKEGILL